MSFKEFLAEQNSPNELSDTMLKLIRANCSNFISHSSAPMLRGIMSNTQNKLTNGNKFFMIEKIKTDRPPRDSAGDFMFNFLFNLGAETITGESLLRTKTLFCTGDTSIAQFYGNTFFVFPQNRFKFMSSTSVADSYKNLQELQTDVLQELKKHKSDDVIDAYNFLNDSELARRQGNIDLKSLEQIAGKKVKHVLEKAVHDTFKSTHKYKHTGDIDSFVKTGSEILIYGIPYVYLINTTIMREFLIAHPNVVPNKALRAKCEAGSPMIDTVYASLLSILKEK